MPTPKKKPAPKKKSPARAKANPQAGDGFTAALAELLRSRKLAVPKGLEAAPPEAYAHQDVSFVEQIAKQPDTSLKVFAEKIASFADRQRARSKAAWDSSPLIAELRRRKLKEPPTPRRAVGFNVSLKKPLKEWTDAQIVKTVNEWSKRGG